jgi:iron complex outermembrane receptor protein
LIVRVTAGVVPLSGVEVAADGAVGITNQAGESTLRVAPGPLSVRAERIGYATVVVPAQVAAGDTTRLDLAMEVEAVEAEGIVVMSTRSDRRIEDEPIRVEVIEREEVEEKLLMTPGDISMLLNETSGVRVQTTATSLGGAGVRIQGLRGRYTLLLSDGLPLYGGQSGALGPLQIPPMDLAQVEVIKGAASALYGANALGGVVNLVSRRPERDRELLLNQTTLGGTDAVAWLADELNPEWGYTVLGGLHRQPRADADDDGWADLAGFRRALLRPRLFWADGQGRSLLATVGGMVEEREGGTTEDGRTPGGTPHAEALETERLEGGFVGRTLLSGGSLLLSVRGSGSLQRHEHRFGEVLETDRHRTLFGEAALSGARGDHAWVLGASLQHDGFRSLDFPAFDFAHTIPGFFAQDEYAVLSELVLSASVRLDVDQDLGTFLNPRFSVLLRPEPWTVRASVGSGNLAPSPLVEEVEAVGLSRVLAPDGELEPERARSASLDIGRTLGPLELNVNAFGSIVDDAVVARPVSGGNLRLENSPGPVRTWGGEALARYALEPIHATLTYAHTRSTEEWEGDRREVPLTPRNTAGLVVAWEQEGRGRVGGELYYTGTQLLDENPYRGRSRGYLVLGFLIERRFGAVRLFLNAENLLDARQTRWDPLILPARSPDGRWTTDAWAPLDGRVLNGGIRWSF